MRREANINRMQTLADEAVENWKKYCEFSRLRKKAEKDYTDDRYELNRKEMKAYRGTLIALDRMQNIVINSRYE